MFILVTELYIVLQLSAGDHDVQLTTNDKY